jgi:transposase
MKKPKVLQLTSEEADDLLKRATTNSLSEKDCEIIKGMVETILVLSRALEEKVTSIKRLLRMLFGIKTEKSKNILKNTTEDSQAETPADNTQATGNNMPDKKDKPKGHGRNGASAYTGAQKIKILHPELKSGDPCPSCENGKVYLMTEVSTLVRITGEPPLQATVYELEKLRCNLCLTIFTAEPPPEVGSKKYNEAAGAMIVMLRYGAGFPFYRLEQFQESLGVPLPDATQWDIAENFADHIHPVYRELIRCAAHGEILHHDDTTMKVLELIKENKNKDKNSRTGIFTTGVVSIVDDKKIGLFFTGGKHAGENIVDVLDKREKNRERPIQMCDALSRNMPEGLETIVANCLAHARRKFVEVIDNFPQECRFVVTIFKDVYRNDAIAKEKGMSAEERLAFHQEKSGPLMEKLRTWCERQFAEKRVEPNSGLGGAITYLFNNHWEELTCFLRVPGAPLDNNICERSLKRAIIHRKNSLFYKTEHGAYVGDLFMSIIHTCKFMKVNPFEYLTVLKKYSSNLFKNPQDWLPWNYEKTVSTIISKNGENETGKKQGTDPSTVRASSPQPAYA